MIVAHYTNDVSEPMNSVHIVPTSIGCDNSLQFMNDCGFGTFH